MIIMFFKGNSFREFVLPNTDNTNYSIILDKEIFELSEDIDVHLENNNKVWHISGTEY